MPRWRNATRAAVTEVTAARSRTPSPRPFTTHPDGPRNSRVVESRVVERVDARKGAKCRIQAAKPFADRLRIPSEGRQLGISGVDLGGIRGRARSTPPVDPLRSGRTSRAYRDAAGPPWSMSGLRPTAPRRATVGRHRGRLRVHDPTTRSRPEGRGAGHPSGCSPRAIATVAWSAARSATITSA